MASFFQKLFDKFTKYDEDDGSYPYESEELESGYASDDVVFEPIEVQTRENTRSGLNLVPMRSEFSQQVIIVTPNETQAAESICQHLQAGRTVVCNFEKCNNASPQRILDFINGSAYALGGQVKRISSNIFLAIPKQVQIVNDSERETGNLSFLRQAAR